MGKLKHYQRGMTLGGLIVVLGFIAILVTFAVRAFPLYNEKMQVVSALNSVAGNAENANLSERELQKAFLKNVQATTNNSRFNDRNVKDYVKVDKPVTKGDPRMLRVQYQQANKLVADLQLLLVVDHAVPLRGGGSQSSE